MDLDQDKEAELIVQFLTADSRQKQLKSYLDRGRKFSTVPLTDLGERFIYGMKKWACEELPWDEEDRVKRNDLEAEFALRGKEPPFHKVLDSLDIVTKRVEREWNLRGPTSTGSLEEEIKDYYRAQDSKN